jgi:hypothetical protein
VLALYQIVSLMGYIILPTVISCHVSKKLVIPTILASFYRITPYHKALNDRLIFSCNLYLRFELQMELYRKMYFLEHIYADFGLTYYLLS